MTKQYTQQRQPFRLQQCVYNEEIAVRPRSCSSVLRGFMMFVGVLDYRTERLTENRAAHLSALHQTRRVANAQASSRLDCIEELSHDVAVPLAGILMEALAVMEVVAGSVFHDHCGVADIFVGFVACFNHLIDLLVDLEK